MKKRVRLKSGTRDFAKPKYEVTLTMWDGGATGPANRARDQVVEPATDPDPETGKPTPNPNGVRRLRFVDMLEIWHRQGVISTAGYNAAEKLRDAFLATQRAPGWPDNDRVQSSPKPDHAVTIQIDRLAAFHDIWKFVTEGDRRILDTCILHDHSPAHLTIAGRRPYYGPRHTDGLRHVRAALDRLAGRMEK